MAVEVESGAYMNQVRGVFSHNPLHDLESLWWVGVWFLICHYDPSNFQDSTVHQHVEVVKKFGETLFNHRFNVLLSRRHALTEPDLLVNIDPGSFPVAVQHLILLLDKFREELVAYYSIYKPMASQDRSFFKPDLFFKFSDIVEKALKKLGNDQTELWPINIVEKNMVYFSDK